MQIKAVHAWAVPDFQPGTRVAQIKKRKSLGTGHVSIGSYLRFG